MTKKRSLRCEAIIQSAQSKRRNQTCGSPVLVHNNRPALNPDGIPVCGRHRNWVQAPEMGYFQKGKVGIVQTAAVSKVLGIEDEPVDYEPGVFEWDDQALEEMYRDDHAYDSETGKYVLPARSKEFLDWLSDLGDESGKDRMTASKSCLQLHAMLSVATKQLNNVGKGVAHQLNLEPKEMVTLNTAHGRHVVVKKGAEGQTYYAERIVELLGNHGKREPIDAVFSAGSWSTSYLKVLGISPSDYAEWSPSEDGGVSFQPEQESLRMAREQIETISSTSSNINFEMLLDLKKELKSRCEDAAESLSSRNDIYKNKPVGNLEEELGYIRDNGNWKGWDNKGVAEAIWKKTNRNPKNYAKALMHAKTESGRFKKAAVDKLQLVDGVQNLYHKKYANTSIYEVDANGARI